MGPVGAGSANKGVRAVMTFRGMLGKEDEIFRWTVGPQ